LKPIDGQSVALHTIVTSSTGLFSGMAQEFRDMFGAGGA
jgi:hypothetical protein